MHEYGVTQNIVNIVCDYVGATLAADPQKNQVPPKVTSIKLVIGELSGIIDESIQMYFDIISKDTPCQGAKLVFVKKPAMLECTGCKNLFKRSPKNFDCPKCGESGRLTEQGKEFYIESIEVE